MGEKLSGEWAAWLKRYEAAENELGAASVHAEDIRLFDEAMAAKDSLMLMAAPDAAAVLTKLEIMWDNPYEERQEENERLIRRDLRAIADLAGSRRAA
ncbi:hypothetical protein [Sphingobium sp. WCS2017Hpa-17]|uniref:hypothetical protein n=1 Tax=Sphingobium sp. WCS2017Hpa-17 TaxID=3073638 RepID=UPI00288B9E89|nr:hypothetical protein [Sphingobium sp. WCS2017Hpa-17]